MQLQQWPSGLFIINNLYLKPLLSLVQTKKAKKEQKNKNSNVSVRLLFKSKAGLIVEQ